MFSQTGAIVLSHPSYYLSSCENITSYKIKLNWVIYPYSDDISAEETLFSRADKLGITTDCTDWTFPRHQQRKYPSPIRLRGGIEREAAQVRLRGLLSNPPYHGAQ